MKVNLIENDKSTYWDEVILGLIVIITMAAGIALIVFKPEFWIISKNSSVMFGVLIAMLGFMYLPCLIYRLFTNDKKER